MKRGVLIRGRVTEKTTGKPVQAAVDYFLFSDNWEYVEGAGDWREGGPINTWTGEHGSFALVGLPRRGIVAAKLWSAKAGSYIVAAGAEQIRGANRDGVFRTYPHACIPQQNHSLHEVNPTPDAESVECNVALDRGKTVTGTVLDAKGKPLAGVRIEGPWGNWHRAYRAQTACFTLTAINPKSSERVFFFHKEKQLGAALRLTGEEPKDFAVRLQPCATIEGRIVDGEGQPRGGLELFGSLGPFQHYPTEGGFMGARTDRQGRFRITGLIPGLKWRAVYVQEGGMFTGQVLRSVTFQAGETKELGDIRVKPIEDE